MKLLRSTVSLALLAMLVAPVALAGDSKIKTTYRSPSAPSAAFKKVVVVLLSPDADLRRRAEGGLARRITNATAATTLISDGEMRDLAAFKARLASGGFDGAILIKPLPIETNETISDQEQFVMGGSLMWGYYESSWNVVTLPGYVNIEKIVTVEVAVFSVADEKPVWMGRMQSTGPKSLRVFLDDLVKVGAAELRKQKVI